MNNHINKNIKFKLTTQEIKYITETFSNIIHDQSQSSIEYRNNLSIDVIENIKDFISNPTIQLKKENQNKLIDSLYYGLGFHKFIDMKVLPDELPVNLLGKIYVNIYKKVVNVMNINFNEMSDNEVTQVLIDEFNKQYN